MEMIIEDRTNIRDSSLLENLVRYAEIMQCINACYDDEIIIDLSRIQFAYPLFLNLLLITKDADKRISFRNTTTYLDTIMFPEAINIERLCTLTRVKTYLPLIADKPCEENVIETSLPNIIANLISEVAGIKSNVTGGIRYILQELIDNVNEHSLAERFYVMVQAYPNKQFVDVCIADNGKGLRYSYEKAGVKLENDVEAMALMASAVSSKERPENESRGYGLFTSRKMSTEGLEGEFLCASGHAVYVKKRNKESVLSLPFCETKGTVVAMRIKYNISNFNIYNYLEY